MRPMRVVQQSGADDQGRRRKPFPRLGTMRTPRRRGAGLAIVLAGLVVTVLASLALGSKAIGIGAVYDAFFHFRGSTDDTIVRGLRVPRTLLGLAVGAALGLAGSVMQGVTRNPLADPGILGVNAGAAFAVVLGIHALGAVSPFAHVWFAIAGAAAASALVYALGSRGRQGATPVRLALAGAGATALLGALTNAILLGDGATFAVFRFWAVGALTGRDMRVLSSILPFLLAGAALAVTLGPALNVLSLGDDAARALGQRVGLTRALSAAAVLLLVGAAVAAAGPIGFVGLMIPHAVRALVGPDYRWVLPYAAVLAPILLIGADILGRVVARPAEVEVAIVTAVLGAPFVVALVRRREVAGL